MGGLGKGATDMATDLGFYWVGFGGGVLGMVGVCWARGIARSGWEGFCWGILSAEAMCFIFEHVH